VRLNRLGIAAGGVYLGLSLLFVWLARPGGAAWPIVLWSVAVAAAGCFVPGEANQVSLARAYLAGPALAYSLAGSFAALALVVAVAGLSDLVDGTVARRFERPTTLGGGLDPVVDGILMGAIVTGLALGGAIPAWLGVVVIARYLLPAVGGLVLIALHRRPELRHTLTGQVSTSLVLILIGGICLFRGLNQDSSGLVAAAEVVIPVATVATYIHLAWVSRRPVAAPGPG
jgi:cardiolipin synthase